MEKTVLSTNTILQGRYRIIQLLGHGGMGAVYEAMDENLRCRVTIKETFATDAEKDVRKAFEREACLLANIRHPAVPKVSDYFEQGDGLFFVMEFIPGIDLAHALKLRGNPLPLQDVLGWADALLAALTELHSFDPPIVHKDIKPSNLKRSPKGEIFLLDFGLAKGALGQMSTVRGPNYSNLQGHTPHFAPPEQIARTGTSPRSDLYSLAATLWCLLTNTLPPDAMMRSDHITNGQPDPLRPAHELNAEVPEAISAVLSQAMSLSKTRRPSDAAEMREALREAIEAPLREQAERERREKEENIRREAEEVGRREGAEAGRDAAEEEFERRLEEERDSNDVAVRQLKNRYESELSSVKRELSKAREEAEQAAAKVKSLTAMANQTYAQLTSERESREELLAELKSEKEQRLLFEEEAGRAESVSREVESLREGERHTAKALAAEKERTRKLESDLKQLVVGVTKLEPLLKEKTLALTRVELALTRVEKERDDALQRAKNAESRLASAVREKSGRRDWQLITAFIVIALMLVAFTSIAIWSYLNSPAARVSDDTPKPAAAPHIETVPIPAGSFLMGSPDSQEGSYADERPQHRVTVQGFNIGKYEVTQAQWRAVTKLPKVEIELNEAPSTFKGDDLPIESVIWAEAVEFCARLSKATGLKYRLPTEAEWEYAARGGSDSATAPDLNAAAWYGGNSGKQPLDTELLWSSVNNKLSDYQTKLRENGCRPHPVGLKAPNGFGLYDMLGNVREWCSDRWHADYKGAPADGSEWTAGVDSTLRVSRGGSWFTSRISLTLRNDSNPYNRYDTVGFRVVLAQ